MLSACRAAAKRRRGCIDCEAALVLPVSSLACQAGAFGEGYHLSFLLLQIYA